MFSCRSDSPLVMNRLTPSMFQVPSSFAVALRAAGADVGAGVRLGEHHGGAPLAVDDELGDRLVALVAVAVRSTPANAGPQPYIQTGAFEPSTISAIAQLSVDGAVGAAELLLDLERASTRRPSRRGSSS